MKALILIAACVIPQFSNPPVAPSILQEEDLGGLSDEKLMEKLKTASGEMRGKIIKELERRGFTIIEQGGGDDGGDYEKDAKETLRTEHFDLKGPDKETLKSKAKELDAMARKFVEIFDTAPKRGVIVFHKEAAGEKERKAGPAVVKVFSRMIRMTEKGEYWTLPWPLLDGESAKDLPLNPERALTHEVMHILFVKHVAEKFPDLKSKVTAGGYQVGSPLPDWLDEGLAVLVEPEEFRTQRAKELKETADGVHPLAKELIPFDRLVEMDHPIVDGKGDALNLFYGQSYLLVDHLLREAGPEVFRTLIAGMAAGRSFAELLKDEKVTKGKLPPSIRELDAALREKIDKLPQPGSRP